MSKVRCGRARGKRAAGDERSAERAGAGGRRSSLETQHGGQSTQADHSTQSARHSTAGRARKPYAFYAKRGRAPRRGTSGSPRTSRSFRSGWGRPRAGRGRTRTSAGRART
eukprot:3647399-Prymnesium_polylepis.1